MDITETLRIMAILRVAYPGYYRDTSKEDAKTAIKLWHTMLGHQPYELVEVAVHSCIATSKWPPTVVEVNAEITALTHSNKMTELEAWNLVAKALTNSGYEAKAEFDALPADIQSVLGSPATLREWAMLPMNEVQTVIASNFQRSYRERASRSEKMLALPENIQKLLCGAIKSIPGGSQI